MASTRSDAATRAAGSPVRADTPKQAFLALARHGARIQLAACTAATKAFTEWAHTARPQTTSTRVSGACRPTTRRLR